MRAVVLEAEGEADVLHVRQVAVPEPARGDVRVAVSHTSLNHLDIWIRKGMPSVPKPRVMGADATGVVECVGEEVDPALVGSRVLLNPSVTCGRCSYCRAGDSAFCDHFQVLGEHRSGTHAEFVVVPRENVYTVPDHLTDAEAAALPLVFVTAWRMIRTRAKTMPGERMLVWGASAGVGTAALQLAAAMGIETIATSRTASKLQVCRELGANHTIDTSDTDVASAVRELTGGRGVEVVFDHLGEVAWQPSLRSLAKGGRYVTCGVTTGANPKASLSRIFWKQLTILGSTMGSHSDFDAMLRFVALTGIRPRVDRTFALDAIRDAHRHLEAAEQVGKVVLQVR